ncbi:MAG: hypothetical protein K6D97_04905 [Clostridia bacterium]|nr:hypothetical protein [Clostridia bacterium]
MEKKSIIGKVVAVVLLIVIAAISIFVVYSCTIKYIYWLMDRKQLSRHN